MSYKNGIAALNMEFSGKIPRTEYSAESHWPLIKAVTGIDTDMLENRVAASQKFRACWDYSFSWSIMVGSGFLEENGGRVTKLGHAVYSENSAGKSDFVDNRVTPFLSPEECYALDPVKEYGEFSQNDLVQRFEKHYQDNCANCKDMVNMSGVYITMFSGLIEIFGWDALLMAMATDDEEFGKVIAGYYEWVSQFFQAYAKTDIPVMMVHDDLCWTSGPVTNPDWYRKYIFPYIKRLLQPVQEAGKKIMFTSDGTIDLLMDDIAALEVDSVVMEPSSNMEYWAQKYGDRIGFVGGMDCRTLTYGTREDIKRDMEKVMAYGQKYPGFMLACGNHLPANVPVDNALYYNELYEKLAYR